MNGDTNCPDCGSPRASRRHIYCATCSARRRRQRGHVVREPASQRGYDGTFVAKRKRWAVRVQAGEAECGAPPGYCLMPSRLIAPGTPWDLGHPNDTKSAEPTPWHRACNRSYASTVTKRRLARPVALPDLSLASEKLSYRPAVRLTKELPPVGPDGTRSYVKTPSGGWTTANGHHRWSRQW